MKGLQWPRNRILLERSQQKHTLYRLGGMRPNEEYAAALLKRAIPGAVPQLISSQSAGEHDLDLVVDERVIAVEVTEHTHEPSEALLSAIYDHEEQGLLRAPGCGGWYVFLHQQAKVREIRRKGPALFRRLEEEGIRSFDIRDDPRHPVIREVWASLRIESATLIDALPAEILWLNGPSEAGSASPDLIVHAVESEANKPDNSRKLARAVADEKHLFVFCAESVGLARHAVLSPFIPSSAPALPAHIDCCWVAARQMGSSAHVVLQFRRASGWRRLGELPLPEMPYRTV